MTTVCNSFEERCRDSLYIVNYFGLHQDFYSYIFFDLSDSYFTTAADIESYIIDANRIRSFAG
jgi:hypothetical protein